MKMIDCELTNKVVRAANRLANKASKVPSRSNARLLVCSQAMAFFELPSENIQSDVKTALSALTAIVMLTNDGYHLMRR